MKYKTFSIGGATYDLFVRLSTNTIHTCDGLPSLTFALGSKLKIKEVIQTAGGGACNTAIGLQRLGCQASFEGAIGNDQWGQALLANFKTEGVNTKCVAVIEHETTSFSIILSASSGERTILYSSGTNIYLNDITFDYGAAAKADWVCLSSLQEQSCEIQNDLIKIFKKPKRPKLTWNPGGCQIEVGFKSKNNCELLSKTTILQLNKEEAFAFTNTKSIHAALKAFIQAGVQNAIITDGHHGTHGTDGTNLWFCPILEGIPVLDTTGAGDAFSTGATWALLNNHTLPQALKAGTINAASVVQKLGAQAGLLTETDMRQKLIQSSFELESQPF